MRTDLTESQFMGGATSGEQVGHLSLKSHRKLLQVQSARVYTCVGLGRLEC
jgi:hypothetical protein